jgi:amidohydrolase
MDRVVTATRNMASAMTAALPHTVGIRQRLHSIPELSYEEHQTADLIRLELRRLSIPFTAGVPGAPTATIGLTGDPAKLCLALRADIDALPVQEETGQPYASTHPGRMHACGHDGHSATLLGTAVILSQLAASLPVCVKLIWQPAEEVGGGAQRLVQAGVLDGRVGPKVQAIFGLHGWPALPVGTVSTRSGPLLASTDSFAATFIGRGCHGAYPHLGIDPIPAACEAVLSLQQCISREFDPTEPGLVTVGTLQAGTAVNIIPDTASISGTVRSFTKTARRKLREAIERRCKGVAAAQGCQLRFEWTEGYPPTINDSEMTAYFQRTAEATLGPEAFIPANRPSMGGEDFAYYLEKVPGCFFFLGVCPPGQETCFPLHSNRYNFNDAALPVGMRMLLALVMSFKP